MVMAASSLPRASPSRRLARAVRTLRSGRRARADRAGLGNRTLRNERASAGHRRVRKTSTGWARSCRRRPTDPRQQLRLTPALQRLPHGGLGYFDRAGGDADRFPLAPTAMVRCGAVAEDFCSVAVHFLLPFVALCAPVRLSEDSRCTGRLRLRTSLSTRRGVASLSDQTMMNIRTSLCNMSTHICAVAGVKKPPEGGWFVAA